MFMQVFGNDVTGILFVNLSNTKHEMTLVKLLWNDLILTLVLWKLVHAVDVIPLTGINLGFWQLQFLT